jgi:hypothetical protein
MWNTLRSLALHCSLAAIAVVSLPLAYGLADVPQSQAAITLRRAPGPQAAAAPDTAAAPDSTVSSGAVARIGAISKDYREFGQARVGQGSEPEFFTFDFHAATRLTAISATADFHVSGGSCIEGHAYAAGDVCNVEVTFTPQGPGHRVGRLSISHSASATPMLTPLGGTAYGPAIQFIPSQIATVPGTSGGTLLSPGGLTVDGGDNLYIADTGNNLIKFRDSSGAITTLVGGGTASPVGYSGFGAGIKLTNPRGVAVDYAGTFYVADTGDNLVLVRYLDGITRTQIGGGSTVSSCSYTSPCAPYNVKITPPYSVATDLSGNLFATLQVGGSLPGFYIAEYEASSNSFYSYYVLNTTAYNYYSTSSAIAVDAYSNLLYTYEDPGGPLLSPTPLCYILGQNRAYSTSSAGKQFWTIAGSGPCGFSGDGGRAISAEISASIGQFALDAAGNLYFTDTGNNRVRRIDATSGVIRTVAGNGENGFGGDGGPSTNSQLQAPVGIGVDSTGRVYATGVASSTAATPPNVKTSIRMFGTVGDINFGGLTTGTHSPALTVLLSNVGNDTLNFTHAGFSSGNLTDFAMDVNTTTCNFTAPLYSGHSCSIGFIFTPGTAGARSAVFSIQDDTVAGVNTVLLMGAGVAPAAKASISPTSLAFGSVTVGATSPAKVITLSNTGTAALGITSITMAGTNPADFPFTKTCGASLAAGANCSVSVTFKPAAAGARSASVSLALSTGTLTAAVGGTGVLAAKASLSPTPVTFGSQTVATASTAKAFTLKNVGGASLTISSYAFTGTNAADFSQTHTCGTSLAGGASCTIHVVFKPTAAGTRTATLAVGTSAGSATAAVSGTGAAAAVKPKVTLISRANPLLGNRMLALVATVAGGAAARPTGSVELKEGTEVLAQGRLLNGTATFQVGGLSMGVHVLQAVYRGDREYLVANSAAVRQVVMPAGGPVGGPVAGPIRAVRVP